MKDKLKEIKLKRDSIIKNHYKYNFPQFIKGLRESLDVSQAAFAKDLKINTLTVMNWESGNFLRPIRKEVIDKVAEYFGVDEDTLYRKCEMYASYKQVSKCE